MPALVFAPVTADTGVTIRVRQPTKDATLQWLVQAAQRAPIGLRSPAGP